MSPSKPPERRSNANGRPPTYLMQSISGMSSAKKKELKRIGYGILIFSFVVPVLASIALRAFVGIGLHPIAWLFCGVGMVVGLALAWPEMGIYMLSRLPAAVAKLLPKNLASKILRRPERRNGDE
ncbi:MAG: hypothetical protein GY906_26495 [bacterium]|nr:hypothetical protein [bacterium]